MKDGSPTTSRRELRNFRFAMASRRGGAQNETPDLIRYVGLAICLPQL
jgi:hypothetical protein